jgi:glycosyltransferase involved in cell wall biosynthesis
MVISQEKIFIIVPTYNEAARIGQVISGLFQYGFKNIVVVDDGSRDETISEVQKYPITILQHSVNRGQGAALETGDEYARRHDAEVVVHFDGDGQFNPEDIAGALKILEEKNVDIVLGSRFLDTRTQMPWLKKNMVFPIGRIINQLLTGVRLTDVHNGFRVLSKRALEKIRITQDRMAHASEIVALIKKHELTYVEMPVEVRYYEYGQGTLGGFRILKEWIVHLITR